MSSRHEIEMDFKKAKEQADKLDAAADSLKDVNKNKFRNTLQNIGANWKGESAALYLSKGETLQGKMSGTESELRNIASDIRRIAKNIYDAEMRAWERAHRHRHNH